MSETSGFDGFLQDPDLLFLTDDVAPAHARLPFLR
jgi:hypothetical protein